MPELGVKTRLILIQLHVLLCPVIADFTPRGGGHSNNEERVEKKEKKKAQSARMLSVVLRSSSSERSSRGAGGSFLVSSSVPVPSPAPTLLGGHERLLHLPSAPERPGRVGMLSVISPVVPPQRGGDARFICYLACV